MACDCTSGVIVPVEWLYQWSDCTSGVIVPVEWWYQRSLCTILALFHTHTSLASVCLNATNDCWRKVVSIGDFAWWGPGKSVSKTGWYPEGVHMLAPAPSRDGSVGSTSDSEQICCRFKYHTNWTFGLSPQCSVTVSSKALVCPAVRVCVTG